MISTVIDLNHNLFKTALDLQRDARDSIFSFLFQGIHQDNEILHRKSYPGPPINHIVCDGQRDSSSCEYSARKHPYVFINIRSEMSMFLVPCVVSNIVKMIKVCLY